MIFVTSRITSLLVVVDRSLTLKVQQHSDAPRAILAHMDGQVPGVGGLTLRGSRSQKRAGTAKVHLLRHFVSVAYCRLAAHEEARIEPKVS